MPRLKIISGSQPPILNLTHAIEYLQHTHQYSSMIKIQIGQVVVLRERNLMAQKMKQIRRWRIELLPVEGFEPPKIMPMRYCRLTAMRFGRPTVRYKVKRRNKEASKIRY